MLILELEMTWFLKYTYSIYIPFTEVLHACSREQLFMKTEVMELNKEKGIISLKTDSIADVFLLNLRNLS